MLSKSEIEDIMKHKETQLAQITKEFQSNVQKFKTATEKSDNMEILIYTESRFGDIKRIWEKMQYLQKEIDVYKSIINA